MLPAFVTLFIVCCVTHFSVLNSIRQFSFINRHSLTAATFVSIVIRGGLCHHILTRKNEVRNAQSPDGYRHTKSTTYLKAQTWLYTDIHLTPERNEKKSNS